MQWSVICCQPLSSGLRVYQQQAMIILNIWTCHRREITGVSNNINNGTILQVSIQVSHDSVKVSQHAQYRTLKLKQLHETQPSFILSVTPLLSELSHTC